MAVPRRANRRRYVLLIVVLTALTLITLDTRNGRSGPIGTLGNAAHTIVGPISGAVDNVASPVSDWWHGVTDSGAIKKENRELKARIAEQDDKLRAAQAALDQNKNLTALLGLANNYTVPLVNARVIGRDPGNFDSTLTINKGTESGIVTDMPVIAPGGVYGSLVGTVIESGRGYAKIRVLTDPEFSVGVTLIPKKGGTATNGIASGQVESNLLLDNDIDAQTKVLPGDRVVTSPSPASLYPPDIPVGTVARVQPQAGGLPQNVYIKPYVDLGGLDYVSVMKWAQGGGAAVRTTTTTTTTTTVPSSTTTTTIVSSGSGG